LLKLVAWWFKKGPYRWQFLPWYKKGRKWLYETKMFFVRHSLAGLLKNLVGALVTLQVFFIVYGWIAALSKPGKKVEDYVQQARDWLNHYHLLVAGRSVALDILLVILL